MSAMLQELWTRTAQAILEVIDAGLEVEPAGGLTDRWREVLERHRVEPLGESTRFERARLDGQAKGAPFDEIRALTAKISEEALAEVAKLDPTHLEPFRAGLGKLGEETLARFVQNAKDRPKGMFGFAKQAAGKHQYAKYEKGTTYVLQCRQCGAPRFQDDNLDCGFCGGKVGG